MENIGLILEAEEISTQKELKSWACRMFVILAMKRLKESRDFEASLGFMTRPQTD